MSKRFMTVALLVLFLLSGCRHQRINMEHDQILGYHFSSCLGQSEDRVLDCLKREHLDFIPVLSDGFLVKDDEHVTIYEIKEDLSEFSYTTYLIFTQKKDGKYLTHYEKVGRKEGALSVTEAAMFRWEYDQLIRRYGKSENSQFSEEVFAKYPMSERDLIRSASWWNEENNMVASFSLTYIIGKTKIYIEETTI